MLFLKRPVILRTKRIRCRKVKVKLRQKLELKLACSIHNIRIRAPEAPEAEPAARGTIIWAGYINKARPPPYHMLPDKVQATGI